MNDAKTTAPQSRGRWRRFLRWFVCVIVGVGIFCYVARGFLLTTLRAYLIGRAYIAAQDFWRFLPEVDEVEVLALGGEAPKGAADSFPPDLGPSLGTVNRRTVHGAEAEEIASVWREIDFDDHFAGKCHQPFYALRFRRHGKLVLETSVCWKCHTYTLPFLFWVIPYGFDANSEPAQKLLSMLTKYAPHPEPSE